MINGILIETLPMKKTSNVYSPSRFASVKISSGSDKDFKCGFSIKSYANIQNFQSIGAMKQTVLWPFENRRFQ